MPGPQPLPQNLLTPEWDWDLKELQINAKSISMLSIHFSVIAGAVIQS